MWDCVILMEEVSRIDPVEGDPLGLGGQLLDRGQDGAVGLLKVVHGHLQVEILLVLVTDAPALLHAPSHLLVLNHVHIDRHGREHFGPVKRRKSYYVHEKLLHSIDGESDLIDKYSIFVIHTMYIVEILIVKE